MSTRAKAFKTLYKRGRITLEALKKALEDGVISNDEYKEIVE